jgi:hypothetical protein
VRSVHALQDATFSTDDQDVKNGVQQQAQISWFVIGSLSSTSTDRATLSFKVLYHRP